MATWSKAWVCGHSPAEIVRSNPTGGMDICCECFVLAGRGLCDELITRPEDSYRLWCVVVCDLETSWVRRPWPTGWLLRRNKKNWGKDWLPQKRRPSNHTWTTLILCIPLCLGFRDDNYSVQSSTQLQLVLLSTCSHSVNFRLCNSCKRSAKIYACLWAELNLYV